MHHQKAKVKITVETKGSTLVSLVVVVVVVVVGSWRGRAPTDRERDRRFTVSSPLRLESPCCKKM